MDLLTGRSLLSRSSGEVQLMRSPAERSPEGATLRARLRNVLSRSTYLGIPPPPPAFRPFGVSAILIAKNEAESARTSVLSILNFVDAVLFADYGSEDPERLSNPSSRPMRDGSG